MEFCNKFLSMKTAAVPKGLFDLVSAETLESLLPPPRPSSILQDVEILSQYSNSNYTEEPGAAVLLSNPEAPANAGSQLDCGKFLAPGLPCASPGLQDQAGSGLETLSLKWV